MAGCTDFRTCAPGRCMLVQNVEYTYKLYREKLMNLLQGAYFLKAMHPARAQNKTLNSNTGKARS